MSTTNQPSLEGHGARAASAPAIIEIVQSSAIISVIFTFSVDKLAFASFYWKNDWIEFWIWIVRIFITIFGYRMLSGYSETAVLAKGHRRLAERVNPRSKAKDFMAKVDDHLGISPDHQNLLINTPESYVWFGQLIKQHHAGIIHDIISDFWNAVRPQNQKLAGVARSDENHEMMREVINDFYMASVAHVHRLRDISPQTRRQILDDIKSDFTKATQIHHQYLQKVAESFKQPMTMNDVYKEREMKDIMKNFDDAIATHMDDLNEIIHLCQICEKATSPWR
ncbi:hypothetical protein F53441_11075 [Fusarium austroafricanum]|uniref:Uncharacterized protein n=1 Tax=Fusarium austroafricanum TaxID=2364996 RepID=A0A8H4K8D9_9HYPO|nr:hypothetical protein F53441_11075 [Fusarium austroafricanum]